jgi:DNA polymerase I-like protein with 3'-5' exonuclease and polymerase domains
MILAAERLPKEARLLATIHDELIVETPEEVAGEALAALEAAMIEGMERGFPGLPTEVSAKVAAAWE